MPRAHDAAFDEQTDAALGRDRGRGCATRCAGSTRRWRSPPHTVLLHTAPVGEDGPRVVSLAPRDRPAARCRCPGWRGTAALHINPVPPEEAARELRDSRRRRTRGSPSAHDSLLVPGVPGRSRLVAGSETRLRADARGRLRRASRCWISSRGNVGCPGLRRFATTGVAATRGRE